MNHVPAEASALDCALLNASVAALSVIKQINVHLVLYELSRIGIDKMC